MTTMKQRTFCKTDLSKYLKALKIYKGDGSFEGWVKRIVINTAIDNYRRKKVKPGSG